MPRTGVMAMIANPLPQPTVVLLNHQPPPNRPPDAARFRESDSSVWHQIAAGQRCAARRGWI